MRALIVDDERLARKELMKLLEDHPSIEVVGEAMNADEAIQLDCRLLSVYTRRGIKCSVTQRTETIQRIQGTAASCI